MNLPNSIHDDADHHDPAVPLDIVAAFSVVWTKRSAGDTGVDSLRAGVITDGLDGYLARKRGQITTMGMLLDPLADKIMVHLPPWRPSCPGRVQPQVVKVWIVWSSLAASFSSSGLSLNRLVLRGFTVTASDLGKLKTVVPDCLRTLAILAHRWASWQIGVLTIPVKWYAIAAIYFTVLVSTISAID